MRGDQDLTTHISGPVPIRLQALSGIYLCLVYLKYILVLSFHAMQRGNFLYFVFLLCSKLHRLPDFLLGVSFTFSTLIFSCSVFIFTVQQRPDHAQASAVLLVCGTCILSYSVYFFLYCGVSSQKEKQEKRAVWDHDFPFLQSFLCVLPISFSPPGSCSVGLKTAVVYS